ncbi:MAG: TIGR02221 family CRISPR-associated protein [Planctomycetaceae bacterium]|jgi:CRISPR-associated Csx2 family protein|nr:TIGR02221 family CRISPR-associated protein [Planctomycetaceae bacterium]
MTRIFISTLGTNDYEECNYVFDNDKEKTYQSRFIQEVTIRHFCKNWDSNKGDRICILCTKGDGGAKKKNWMDNGQFEKDEHGPLTKKPKTCRGLESTLNEMIKEADYSKLNIIDSCIEINDGKNTDEIWSIFDAIYSRIEDGDEVYFDITHAFRSIPMLIMVVIPYAKVLKNITIANITYGAFDARDSKTKEVPVFNLTDFVKLMDWTSAAKEFVDYGKTASLKTLINMDNEPVLKATKGTDKTAQILKKSMRGIEEFAASIFTNNLQEIYNFNIKPSVEELKKENENNIKIKPFVPLIEKITKKVSCFNRNDWSNVFEATQWCVNHEMYQNAYSILLEGIISISLEQVGEPSDKKSGFRKLPVNAAEVVRKSERNLIESREENIQDLNDKEKEICEKICGIYSKEIAQKICNLNSYRNSYMHAGTGEPIPRDVTKKISEYKEILETWWASLPTK